MLGTPPLWREKRVGATQLMRPAIGKSSRILPQVEVVHQLLHILAAGEDHAKAAFEGIASLKSVADRIEQ